MPETRRKYAVEFGERAVRIVRETGTSIAQVPRDPGINPRTLGNSPKRKRRCLTRPDRQRRRSRTWCAGTSAPSGSSTLVRGPDRDLHRRRRRHGSPTQDEEQVVEVGDVIAEPALGMTT
jgi:transposase-like protein